MMDQVHPRMLAEYTYKTGPGHASAAAALSSRSRASLLQLQHPVTHVGRFVDPRLTYISDLGLCLGAFGALALRYSRSPSFLLHERRRVELSV